MGGTRMRLFFALDLPEELKSELGAFQRRGQALGIPASWPDATNLHLTLAFLGEQAEDRLPMLQEIGTRVAGRCLPFPLRTTGLGGFPRPAQARVLWLGLEVEARLDALTRDLRQGLADRAFPVDKKPFTAHLTLARFPIPAAVQSFEPNPEPRTFEVRELALFRSQLGPKGARYERIAGFALGKSTPGFSGALLP